MRDPLDALPAFDDGGPGRLGPTPIQWALLAARAAWRRKLLFLSVLLPATGLVTAYYLTKQPVYRAEAKILAQRQQSLPSAVRGLYEEAPTRSAWEIIHRRENLIAVARAANLLPASPPAAEGPGAEPPAAIADGGEDPVEAVVRILDRQLLVGVEDGTITLQLDWRDPRTAYDVVRNALENFLEARYVQEVKALDEVMSVLQGRAAAHRQSLENAIEEARKRGPILPRAVAPRVRQPSETLVRLQSLLEAKRRAIQDVEEFRRRRLADLQAQLDQARNAMSDAHPTVIGLRKDIEAMSRESSQVAALREDEARVRTQYQEQVAREGLPPTSAPVVIAPVADGSPAGEDQRVRDARLQYEQVMSRIGGAQLELDAARAAFKYRYEVIWPPQVPTDPVSPNPRKIFGLGGILALCLAFATAAAPDVLSRRIVERWQVERTLGLPIVGEIRRS